ncbi:hypothetical protein [Blastococcus sp. SYSU D00813]
MRDSTVQERHLRVLVGVVGASGLVYPMLLCAVQLVFAQFLAPDGAAVAFWLGLGVVSSVALVATVRWTAGRRVLSPWLLAGLLPPALYELWLVWPALTE